jgi:DNA polymerase IV
MILHVDMDAFYASVEERDHPELVGKPVIVGGTPEGRGVVCAANYVARQYGVHSAMAAVTARRLCPEGIFLPVRMDYYAQISRDIREIFDEYTPLVEPLSLDEAFLDVTGCPIPKRKNEDRGLKVEDRKLATEYTESTEGSYSAPSVADHESSSLPFSAAAEIGKGIKEEIRRRVQLVASVGVAPNKFLAKLASDLQKPDGFVVVAPDRVLEFLDPLPVGRLWGVGKVSGKAFQKLGITTIGQLGRLPVDLLESHFGKSGRHFWQLAHGIDDRRVVTDREAKSISSETTFAKNIDDSEILRIWLLQLTEQVAYRLRQHELAGRTVQLKIRFADFHTITRSHTLGEPTNITEEIWRAAAELLNRRRPAGREAVRLLGVGMSGLESSANRQASLFDETQREKQQKLDEVTDRIRERFGGSALHRAARLKRGDEAP